MDRQRLRPRARRPAAPARGRRRPARPQGPAHDRAGDLRASRRSPAAFATTAAWLAIARGRMGVGGACTMPSTLSVLGNIFPEQERGQGDLGVVGGRRAHDRGRPGDRRAAAGALLVGLGVPRERARRDRRARSSSRGGCRGRTTPRRRRSTAGARSLWWGALERHHPRHRRGPAARVGARRWCSAPAAGGLLLLRRVRAARGPLARAAHRGRDPPRPAPAVGRGGGVGAVLRRDGHAVRAHAVDPGPAGRTARSRPASTSCRPRSPRCSSRCSTRRWPARWGHGLVARPRARGHRARRAGRRGRRSWPRACRASSSRARWSASASASPRCRRVELIMSSARPERAGSASGVNETLVEASGALGIAVLGSVLVETGSYAWPLPVVAAGRGRSPRVGVAPRSFRPKSASQSSIERSADALSSSGAPDPVDRRPRHRRQRVVVEPHLGAGELVLVRAAPVRTAAGRRR